MKTDEERRRIRRESVKRWKKKHPDKTKAIYVSNNRRWTKLHPEHVKRDDLRKYGLTLEEYCQMLEDQEGSCAICGRSFTKEFYPNVDHNHTTSKVRGLLCTPCNRGLGLFQDNPDILRAAATYLEKS